MYDIVKNVLKDKGYQLVSEITVELIHGQTSYKVEVMVHPDFKQGFLLLNGMAKDFLVKNCTELLWTLKLAYEQLLAEEPNETDKEKQTWKLSRPLPEGWHVGLRKNTYLMLCLNYGRREELTPANITAMITLEDNPYDFKKSVLLYSDQPIIEIETGEKDGDGGKTYCRMTHRKAYDTWKCNQPEPMTDEEAVRQYVADQDKFETFKSRMMENDKAESLYRVLSDFVSKCPILPIQTPTAPDIQSVEQICKEISGENRHKIENTVTWMKDENHCYIDADGKKKNLEHSDQSDDELFDALIKIWDIETWKEATT